MEQVGYVSIGTRGRYQVPCVRVRGFTHKMVEKTVTIRVPSTPTPHHVLQNQGKERGRKGGKGKERKGKEVLRCYVYPGINAVPSTPSHNGLEGTGHGVTTLTRIHANDESSTSKAYNNTPTQRTNNRIITNHKHKSTQRKEENTYRLHQNMGRRRREGVDLIVHYYLLFTKTTPNLLLILSPSLSFPSLPFPEWVAKVW